MDFARRIIESTAAYAACFKPNSAFYEAHGVLGLRALKDTVAMVPEGTPVIVDAKRGDIGNTAAAYAEAVLGWLGADAVTLSPYLGRESAEPFLAYREKGLFVLCRTSNPGSSRFQDEVLRGTGLPLYLAVAEEAVSWSGRVGLVAAANMPQELQRLRRRHPDVWILAPGIGAQGGRAAEAVAAGLREDGAGILLSASRSVAGADSPARAARSLRDEINRARSRRTHPGGGMRAAGTLVAHGSDGRQPKRALIRELIELGCFRTGRFTLKSGDISPIYIDLRLVISRPSLLDRIADAYADLLQELDFDRIAGIPFAGIPLATAVSLRTGKPMVFPRLTVKAHGSGRLVEGLYRRGETVVLLDDLITTGRSKLEAAEVLRSEGLEVRDLVVLVERGTTGRREMREAGIRLRRYISIGEMLEVCLETGRITRDELDAIEAALKEP
jgi:uridine monophosphate synthetase